MAQDEVNPDVIDDLNERAEKDDAELPEDIEVPLNVGDDEAVQAVKKQFADAGTECTDDEARHLVQAARKKAEQKKASKNESDDQSGDAKDGTADDEPDRSDD